MFSRPSDWTFGKRRQRVIGGFAHQGDQAENPMTRVPRTLSGPLAELRSLLEQNKVPLLPQFLLEKASAVSFSCRLHRSTSLHLA